MGLQLCLSKQMSFLIFVTNKLEWFQLSLMNYLNYLFPFVNNLVLGDIKYLVCNTETVNRFQLKQQLVEFFKF